MSFAKLKKLHIIIIGSVLIIGAAVAMFFLMIKPQRAAFDVAKGRFDAADPLGSPSARNTAEMDRVKAFQEKTVAEQTLNSQMERRMPKLNFSNREAAMIALWHEQIENLGPTLENFARGKQENVKVVSANFQLPAPPVNPNDAVFTQDMLTFDLGVVTAQGDFKSLMNNVRRWNNCNRLVMLGPPQIGGISPQLTVSYSVRCFVYPVAVASANSTIQIAGAATAGAPGSTAMAMPTPGATPGGMPPPAGP